MQRPRRSGGLMTAAVVVSLVLGACSTTTGSTANPTTAASAGESAAATTSAAPSTTGGLTLTLWHNTADPEAILNLYKAYEAASGNKVELVDVPADGFETTTQTKWATGDRPDILEYHGIASAIATLNPEKNLFDLSGSDFIAKEGPLGAVAGVYNGKTYAATVGFPQVFGVYYNKQVFQQAGLQPPTSFADVQAACSTLKSKVPGVDPIFEAGGSGWPAQLMTYEYMAESNVKDSYGQAVMTGATQLTDPNGAFIKGMNNYIGLRDAGCFNKNATSAKFEDSLKAVLDGKAAMVIQHSDMITILNTDANGDKNKVDSTVGFVGVSATQPISTYIPTPLGTYYVPKTGNADKEAAAKGFLDFITGPGYATYVQEAGAIPAYPGTPAPTLQGLTQDVAKAWQNSALFPSASMLGFDQFNAESGKLLAGQETPDQVAQHMQVALEQAKAAAQ